MALPTAAMICWQVGAHDEARAYIEEAMPLHDAGPRIAKVVLYSAAAGLALADGDSGGAAELAARADADGTELGVERELPLVRAISARALLAARGPAARGRPGVGVAGGRADDLLRLPARPRAGDGGLVSRQPAAVRRSSWRRCCRPPPSCGERGDRPPPASMPAPDVPAAPSERLDPRAAARLARKLLADL